MKDIKQLHELAMASFQEGLVCRHLGRESEASSHFLQALEAERTAAMQLENQFEQEPTRSILFRSAASLAIDCGNTEEALRLIQFALAGNPPENIVKELREMESELRRADEGSKEDLLASLAEHAHDDYAFSEMEMRTFIESIGRLTESERRFLHKKNSLVERMMRAMAAFLLTKASPPALRRGDAPTFP